MVFATAGLVLILVAGEDAGPRATRSFSRAIDRVEGAHVDVRSSTVRPHDDGLREITGRAGGATSGWLEWSDAGKKVRIHLFRPDLGRFIERRVEFDDADPPEERGRAAAFTVASMTGDADPPAFAGPGTPTTPAPAATGTPPAAASASASSATAEPPPAAGTGPNATAPAAPPVSASPAPPPSPPAAEARGGGEREPHTPWLSLDAAGLAALGLGQAGAGGFGGELSGRVRLGQRLGFRLAGSARSTNVPAARASAVQGTLTAGLAWQSSWTMNERLVWGAHLDAGLAYADLAHFDGDEPEAEHHGRLLPAAVGAVEVGLRLGATSALMLAAGAEVAFGSTDVFVEREQVATMPPVRAFTTLGIRVLF